MKAVVAAFNQEKALVGAFSVITNLRMELFEALVDNNMTISMPDPVRLPVHGAVRPVPVCGSTELWRGRGSVWRPAGGRGRGRPRGPRLQPPLRPRQEEEEGDHDARPGHQVVF